MRPSIYDVAGGESAFLALARAHHQRCLDDPELNHPFSHSDQHPQHVERLAAYWAEVLGGPPVYSEQCANESYVVEIHCGNGDLTDLQRRFLECFVAAIDDAGLPVDEELRTALRSYMEWATRNQLDWEGKPVPPAMPLPRWSWDGLQQ